MNTTLQTTPNPTVDRRLARMPELVAAVAAPICALVTWLMSVVVGGVDLSVTMAGTVKQVGWLDIALTAFGAGLLGLLALRLLRRVTARARGIWTAIALVVLAGSLVGPLAATNQAALWTLVTLHSVVAAVVLAIGWRARW